MTPKEIAQQMIDLPAWPCDRRILAQAYLDLEAEAQAFQKVAFSAREMTVVLREMAALDELYEAAKTLCETCFAIYAVQGHMMTGGKTTTLMEADMFGGLKKAIARVAEMRGESPLLPHCNL